MSDVVDQPVDTTLETTTIAPEVLEQKMVEQELAADPSGLPYDKAAAFFQKSAIDLEILLNNMSLRALKRMIMNVATYPYLDRNYTVKKGSNEEKASYRFNEMIWQKTIMQLQFEQEKALKAMEDEKLNNESNNSLIKGEQNVEGTN